MPSASAWQSSSGCAGEGRTPGDAVVENRYAEARPNAAAIIAACWSGGAMKTSLRLGHADLFSIGTAPAGREPSDVLLNFAPGQEGRSMALSQSRTVSKGPKGNGIRLAPGNGPGSSASSV